MLFSSLLVHNASKVYKESRQNENYQGSCNGGGSSLLMPIAFLVIEIAMLYFAVKVALVSGKSSTTKFINIVFALTMTLPYLLLSLLFNPEARAELGDGTPASGSLRFACNC